jgi:hypothetical protein
MQSVPDVAHVELLRGPDADPDATPDLLVEVPHGADERAHYDRLRRRLRGPLPDDLHEFFFANTDRGAWAIGREVAERVIAARPSCAAVLVRCLLPRTFVDTNRRIGAVDTLAAGGLTAAVPVYVEDPQDRAFLAAQQRAYLDVIEPLHAAVGDAGGFALLPHTYGPRSMGIAGVDASIVENLRAAWADWERWPLRPEVELITRDPDGTSFVDETLCAAVMAGLTRAGFEVGRDSTYNLHPATQAARFATARPGQTLCLEVRRDLLVEDFALLEERPLVPARITRAAAPLAEAVAGWLSRRRG